MFTDWRGNTLEIGDTVVYPTRTGSRMALVEGTIEGMARRRRYSWRTDTEMYLTIKPIREGTHNSPTTYRSTYNRRVTLKYVTKVV